MAKIALPKKAPLFFNDGFVFDRERVMFASQLVEFSGSPVARLSVIKNYLDPQATQWAYSDVGDAMVSVTGFKRGADRFGFFLGINGAVVTMGPGQVQKQVISDTDKYGRMLRIRAIGEDVVACGMSGQLFSNAGGSWQPIDQGLLGADGLDFEDIDGTSLQDLYAVGIGGIMFHYDGRAWKQLDSPTNRPLSNVRCRSSQEVFVCGNSGTFFKGSASQGWQMLTDDEVRQNFWGMDLYQGKVYLAYAGGLLVHDGNAFSPVDFGLPEKIECHRVHSADGILWSIGIDHLAFYDGTGWRRVICPMNVP
jgi:hypothetical protein